VDEADKAYKEELSKRGGIAMLRIFRGNNLAAFQVYILRLIVPSLKEVM
jgi:hypothetical protein